MKRFKNILYLNESTVDQASACRREDRYPKICELPWNLIIAKRWKP